MYSNIKIKSPEMLANVLKEKRTEGIKEVAEELTREEQMKIDHIAMATQWIKIINTIPNLEPFIKKVMTLRLLGPIITNYDKSHLSIALELGVCEDDVIQAELYGKEVLADYVSKVTSQDSIDKFNKDETVKRAVSNMGKQMQAND